MAQAVLVNSGNANACTGAQGIKDGEAASAALARELGIRPGLVVPSSTGVIGVPLPVEKLVGRSALHWSKMPLPGQFPISPTPS